MHSPLNDKNKSRLRVGKSYAGYGLFATDSFKKGERVVEYVGYKVPNKVIEDMKGDNKYLFDLNKTHTIDGRPKFNIARWANHACKPNAEADTSKGRIYLSAIKNIKPGDEITWDYGKEYFDEYIGKEKCRCNSCRA